MTGKLYTSHKGLCSMELLVYLCSYSVTWAYIFWTSMQWRILIWKSGLAEMYLEGIVYPSARLDLLVRIR